MVVSHLEGVHIVHISTMRPLGYRRSDTHYGCFIAQLGRKMIETLA